MHKYSKNSLSQAHPTYESSRSKEQCKGCQKYEEDILLLQEKLIDTHNKLIQQLDICRQHQVAILKLSELNVSENQQSRANKDKSIKFEESESLLLNKNELLRNDLETMRNKVLTEILKSNKLKDQNKELVLKHEKQLNEYRQRIFQLQQINKKLGDQNQQLIQECQELQRHFANKTVERSRCCEHEQKYVELDRAFMNQRAITNELIQENNALHNQLHEEKVKLTLVNEKKQTTQKRRRKTPKKGNFEQTKNLIKELQKAQKEIRNKYNE